MSLKDTAPERNLSFYIFLILGASLAPFLCSLDMSIANVSIPTIAGDFSIPSNQGVHAITAYLIGEAIGIAMAGWLSKLFGDVRLILWAIFAFIFFSWVCASSISIQMLSVSRLLQGLSAGPIIPLSQSLFFRFIPKKDIPKALALGAVLYTLSWLLGPLLGGWITINFGWPWIFYINIPFGLLSALFIWLALNKESSPQENAPIDYLGLLLIVISVPCLQIALDNGQLLNWFASPVIRTLLLIAFIGLAFFFFWETVVDKPFFELKFYKKRSFLISTYVLWISAFVDFGYFVLYPLWNQVYQDFDAFWSGVALLPFGIAAIVSGPLYGPLVKLLGLFGLFLFSALLGAASCFYHVYFTTPNVDLFHMWIPRFFFGCSIVLNIIGLGTYQLEEIDKKDYVSATGLYQFSRAFFCALGTSLFLTLWERRGTYHHNVLIESITPAQDATEQALQHLEAAGLSYTQAIEKINKLTNIQAAYLSLNDCLFVMGWLFLLSIPALFFMKNSQFAKNPNLVQK